MLLQGEKTEVIGGKIVPMPLRKPQIPRGWGLKCNFGLRGGTFLYFKICLVFPMFVPATVIVLIHCIITP